MKLSQIAKIMVIDDNPESLDSISEALLLNGYPNEKFQSPKEALVASQKRNYDLVITDYKMQEMNGVELAKSIQQYNPNIFIILISGFLNSEIDTAIKKKNYAFFRKPIDVESFLESISQIQKKKNLNDSNSRLEKSRIAKE